jgi:toluene monooxygenase electron transfer component
LPNEHRIRLDGTADTYACRPDETLLKAGLEAGLRLPYECSTGSCGSCRARLVSGEVESRWPDAPGLSSRDRTRGRILCCQSEPRGDVTIAVELLPPGPEPRPGARSARVTEIVPLTEDTLRIVCEPAEPLHFLPGQYVLFVIPGTRGRRAYSMCDQPHDGRRLDFIVRARPGGVATSFLFEKLRPGDPLALEGPYGRAFLRTPIERDLALAAGGSGLGPMLSILRAALEGGGAEERRITLVFGVRRRRDLFDVELLEELARAHPNLEVVLALSEPEPEEPWNGEVGFVHDVLLRRVADLTERQVYMAGPAPMINALLHACVFERKMAPDRLRFDRFS